MRLFCFAISLLVSLLVKAEERPNVVLTTGHSDYVIEMMSSPNGRFLASSGTDKVIKIWDVATAQEYRTLSGFDGRVNDLIFSNDNVHLAGLSGHGELFVWNVLTGEVVFKEKSGNSSVRGIAFSKDGKKLIHGNGSNGNLTFTSLESGTSREIELYSAVLAVDSVKPGVASKHTPRTPSSAIVLFRI